MKFSFQKKEVGGWAGKTGIIYIYIIYIDLWIHKKIPLSFIIL